MKAVPSIIALGLLLLAACGDDSGPADARPRRDAPQSTVDANTAPDAGPVDAATAN
jgi:hypothetical protein